jgi:hypothetical protein
MTAKRFEGQGLHVTALALLLGSVAAAATLPEVLDGAYGLTTAAWLAVAMGSAVAHQVYVWFCWRWELHGGALTRFLGGRAFALYACGFFLLLLSRPAALTFLAWSNRHTAEISEDVRWAVCVALGLPLPYLLYSASRYLGWRRVAGLDHFEPCVAREGLVRGGIFRWTPNALYTFGPLAMWIPGLALQSYAALAAAAFMHAYIWVHYYCTERPDMRALYAGMGATPARAGVYH